MASETTCVAVASASAGALARLGVAEGARGPRLRGPGLLRPSARRICACLQAFGLEDLTARLLRSAIIWRPMDSTRFGGGLMSLISTRVTLMPQGCAASSTTRSRRSLIASRLRQELVEIHRAHHRADIGHGQVEDGVLQARDLIGRLRRIEHLVEGDAVDRRRWRCPW